MKPTNELYTSIQFAYDFFNVKLFDSQLPDLIFTVQRKKGIMGYFAPERWGTKEGRKCHEIAINPAYVAQSRLIEVMQTLVHEMVHCWQECLGTPSRRFYHNREWARKMESLGLMPSSTGRPGGDKTGQKMHDYPIKGGLFMQAYNELVQSEKFELIWIDRITLKREQEILRNQEDTDSNYSNNSAENSYPDNESKDLGASIDFKSNQSESVIKESFYDNVISPQTIDTFALPIEAPVKNTRTRYFCPSCNTVVYGKQKLNILCMDCNIPYKG